MSMGGGAGVVLRPWMGMRMMRVGAVERLRAVKAQPTALPDVVQVGMTPSEGPPTFRPRRLARPVQLEGIVRCELVNSWTN